MTDDYLPQFLTVAEACAYLAQRTSSPWTLPRLLDACPVPWVWLEYSPGWPAIFGNRLEGFAAPMLFAGDVQRLRAQPDDALLTTSRTPEGELFRVDTGIRFPLSELRFRRDDVMAQASSDDTSPEVRSERTSTVASADDEMAAAFDAVPVAALEKMFSAGGMWERWAEHPKDNGLAAARVRPGKYNPYRAGVWFLSRGLPDWDLARVYRVLRNNLPARSQHLRDMFGE